MKKLVWIDISIELNFFLPLCSLNENFHSFFKFRVQFAQEKNSTVIFNFHCAWPNREVQTKICEHQDNFLKNGENSVFIFTSAVKSSTQLRVKWKCREIRLYVHIKNHTKCIRTFCAYQTPKYRQIPRTFHHVKEKIIWFYTIHPLKTD